MITVRNVSKMEDKKVGKLRSCILQWTGRKFEITLENVQFLTDILINLFNINKILMNGFMIGNEDVMINLKMGETTLVFNQPLNTKGGFVSGIKLKPALNQVVNTAVRLMIVIKTISVEINKLHNILGHCEEAHLKATTNDYGIKVFRKLEVYESCAISKAKQKNPNKVWTGSSNVPGERCIMLRGQSHFMIYFRLFQKLDLVCQTGM
jgi:hypothetical protein